MSPFEEREEHQNQATLKKPKESADTQSDIPALEDPGHPGLEQQGPQSLSDSNLSQNVLIKTVRQGV